MVVEDAEDSLWRNKAAPANGRDRDGRRERSGRQKDEENSLTARDMFYIFEVSASRSRCNTQALAEMILWDAKVTNARWAVYYIYNM